ncbi:WD40 repeat-like protein [Flagelloscypha sp. PMI_526]|nr:WD40 repeat-like protein [Flagelloscypha sp. PMI_526]
MDYEPVVVPSARPGERSPESRYWRQFKNPVFVKEYAHVTSVHFSPAKPHRYAVTAATRVQLYAPRTQKVAKTISRFKDVARSAHIRNDGKLLVAGDDTGLIQIFDINSRAILRTLDTHKQPVHVTKFSSLNPTQVLSCSDDATAMVWDVPSQSSVATFTSHSDYVRSGQFSTSNPNVVLTGSYDSTVRLHDSRTGQCEMLMLPPSSGNNAPVEQVLMFPSGTAVVSSAGSIMRIWDIVAGGRCIRALSNHQKTVTSLTFAQNATRLLTGGLDQMVKVYDVSNYKVVHTIRYPAPILCLAVSPDDTHIAAGMTDGTLSVRQRRPKPSELERNQLSSTLPTSIDGLSGMLPAVGQGTLKDKSRSKGLGDMDEFRVEAKRMKRLRDYDRFLKSFRYSAALDAVLKKNVPPTTTFSLIHELVVRDGLRSALSGRDEVMLEPMITVLLKYVSDPRFGELVCDITKLLIELYTPLIGQSPLIDTLLLRLRKKSNKNLNSKKKSKKQEEL